MPLHCLLQAMVLLMARSFQQHVAERQRTLATSALSFQPLVEAWQRTLATSALSFQPLVEAWQHTLATSALSFQPLVEAWQRTLATTARQSAQREMLDLRKRNRENEDTMYGLDSHENWTNVQCWMLSYMTLCIQGKAQQQLARRGHGSQVQLFYACTKTD